jgi:hypothetical protein
VSRGLCILTLRVFFKISVGLQSSKKQTSHWPPPARRSFSGCGAILPWYQPPALASFAHRPAHPWSESMGRYALLLHSKEPVSGWHGFQLIPSHSVLHAPLSLAANTCLLLFWRPVVEGRMGSHQANRLWYIHVIIPIRIAPIA